MATLLNRWNNSLTDVVGSKTLITRGLYLEPLTQVWYNKVLAAGASATSKELKALNQFEKDVKSITDSTAYLGILPVIGSTHVAARIPFLSPIALTSTGSQESSGALQIQTVAAFTQEYGYDRTTGFWVNGYTGVDWNYVFNPLQDQIDYGFSAGFVNLGVNPTTSTNLLSIGYLDKNYTNGVRLSFFNNNLFVIGYNNTSNLSNRLSFTSSSISKAVTGGRLQNIGSNNVTLKLGISGATVSSLNFTSSQTTTITNIEIPAISVNKRLEWSSPGFVPDKSARSGINFFAWRGLTEIQMNNLAIAMEKFERTLGRI